MNKIEQAARAALAALSQNKVHPADIELARKTLADALPPAMPSIFERVAEELRKMLPHASAEYPGWISIPKPNGIELAIGTVNGPWQIDVTRDDGARIVSTIDVEIPADCDDAAKIAEAIDHAISENL